MQRLSFLQYARCEASTYYPRGGLKLSFPCTNESQFVVNLLVG